MNFNYSFVLSILSIPKVCFKYFFIILIKTNKICKINKMFSSSINHIKEFLKVFVSTTHHIALIPKPTHVCTIDDENWNCRQCDTVTDVNTKISQHNSQIQTNVVHLYMVLCIDDYFENKKELNAIFDVLVNHISMTDLLYVAFVAFKNRCKCFADILNVKQLYHTEMHIINFTYNNGTITYQHNLKWISLKILRILVGTINHGRINDNHLHAINYGLSLDNKGKLSESITKMFKDHNFVSIFETFFRIHLKNFDYGELYKNYLQFGLNLRDTQLFERLGF
jgi:hypothetical protein